MELWSSANYPRPWRLGTPPIPELAQLREDIVNRDATGRVINAATTAVHVWIEAA